MVKYFGIIDEATFKGYSNTVKSLLEDVKDKEIIDLSLENAEEKVLEAGKDGKISVVSAADMGIKFFEKIAENKDVAKNINLVLSSDKFYDIEMKNIKNISLVMPEEAISQYKERNPDVKISSYPADLVASPSKKNMEERASDFARLNPITEIISNVLSGDAKAFFMGGRVSLPDGSFKENTKEIFAKAGSDFVKDGKNGAIVFHGLRSFTKGDKSNDFEPVNAFYDALKSGMLNNQTIVMLTKEEVEDGKRKSIAKIFQKENGIVFINDYNLQDSTFPAADYYYLLNEVVKKGLDLTATVEQMNFIPEALELGADRTKFKPYKWELSVPSNHAVYQKVFDGKDVKTQKQAFDELVRNTNTENVEGIVLNNFAKQR
ncbi:MAG: hypothetical protein IJ473_01795 [Alphaproteobacteria bacterium]|nr:hypothetical protein [Alphaproteobacteria bacterium]